MRPMSQGRDLPLQFATWQMIMRIVGAPKGVKTWHCPLPNHRDADPSFSAGPGREPGTTVVACSCGQRAELLDYFRKRGYRLGPMRMTTPKREPRPVIATTSVAWRALTPSERRMFELVKASDDELTYNDFVSEGISSSAISVGLRALQALGFLAVKRSPRLRGCRRYQRNLYQIERGWLRYEPDRLSRGTKRTAVEDARAVARAARNGGEDISNPVVKPETSNADLRISEVPLAAVRPDGKTESRNWGWEDSLVLDQALGEKPRKMDLRISVPRVSTSDSGAVTYVGRGIDSKTQDSLRPTSFDVGNNRWSEPQAPPHQTGDPGPAGWETGTGPIGHRTSDQFQCDNPYACGKADECCCRSISARR